MAQWFLSLHFTSVDLGSSPPYLIVFFLRPWLKTEISLLSSLHKIGAMFSIRMPCQLYLQIQIQNCFKITHKNYKYFTTCPLLKPSAYVLPANAIQMLISQIRNQKGGSAACYAGKQWMWTSENVVVKISRFKHIEVTIFHVRYMYGCADVIREHEISPKWWHYLETTQFSHVHVFARVTCS